MASVVYVLGVHEITKAIIHTGMHCLSATRMMCVTGNISMLVQLSLLWTVDIHSINDLLFNCTRPNVCHIITERIYLHT